MVWARVLCIAISAEAVSPWVQWNVPYVPGAVINDTDLPAGGFTPGNPNRQFLSLAVMPGTTASNKTGVHLFAHGSGGVLPSIGATDLESILTAGYALITWESVTDLNGNADYTPAEYVATCRADLQLVLAWLVANAEAFNLDLNDVNFGGRSRGSMCSWGAAHADHPELNVTGIYMYNAMPFQSATDAEFEVVVLDPITVDSPPTYLAYGPWCPKPITQSCVPSPNPADIHNPRFGQKIVQRYGELGIGNRITLTDGMDAANLNTTIYVYFDLFIESLYDLSETTTPPTTLASTLAPTTVILDVHTDIDHGTDDGTSCATSLWDRRPRVLMAAVLAAVAALC